MDMQETFSFYPVFCLITFSAYTSAFVASCTGDCDLWFEGLFVATVDKSSKLKSEIISQNFYFVGLRFDTRISKYMNICIEWALNYEDLRFWCGWVVLLAALSWRCPRFCSWWGHTWFGVHVKLYPVLRTSFSSDGFNGKPPSVSFAQGPSG